jgi:SAM-dependent methyltransferase
LSRDRCRLITRVVKHRPQATGHRPQATGHRARSEALFHDARASLEKPTRLNFVYVAVADAYDFTRVPEAYLSRTLLEVGCFKGRRAERLSSFSGNFIGIDISPTAIEHCKALDLGPRFRFEVDDANVLATVSKRSIDFAYGDGVLHHLDLAEFSKALSSRLHPTGIARFVEPAQGNLLVRAFRWLTPKLRTDDERPFDGSAIQTLREHFDVHVHYHGLLRPFLPILFFNNRSVVQWCRRMDDWLLKHEWLQSQAWLLNVELRPKR